MYDYVNEVFFISTHFKPWVINYVQNFCDPQMCK
jgi:hypothetical protein